MVWVEIAAIHLHPLILFPVCSPRISIKKLTHYVINSTNKVMSQMRFDKFVLDFQIGQQPTFSMFQFVLSVE